MSGPIAVWLDVQNMTGRVSVSSGIVLARTVNSLRYHTDAFIPRPPWQELSSVFRGDPPTRAFVGVFRLPKIAVEQAVSYIRSQGLEERWVAIELLKREILARFACDGRIVCDGVQTNPQNLPTVTLDLDRHTLVGLHVDQWDHLPLPDRARSRLRVAVNIGAEPRWFMFIPRTIQDMAAVLIESRGLFQDPNVLAREFLGRCPDLQVVRVRVDPGEAYIAPTENIVHDASSLGNTTPCCNIVFRGCFKPIQLKWSVTASSEGGEGIDRLE